MSEVREVLAVGLMSGTSVDGIDVAVVALNGAPPQLQVRLRHFETVPFSEEVRERIFALFQPETATLADLSQMNFLLGEVFADAVLQTLHRAGIACEEIAFVASHGQTVWHSPVPELIGGYPVASTLQIGEASVIAERTGIPTISDFRVRDVAAGGQGAPLVPFVDRLLFAQPGQGRILANIGGIANLTVLPAAPSTADVEPADVRVMAFDTGPGNMILDGLVQKATNGALAYDKDGALARAGQVREDFLARWLSLPYFAELPPKSTGRELFGAACVEAWWQEGREHGLPPEDLIATATEFTVRTFVEAVQRFVLPHYDIAELVIGGGGAYNPQLLGGIRRGLPDLQVVTQETTGIPSDAKEAVAFAVLGYECFHRRPNNLPSATGAKRPVVLGKIVWS
jgi:anhydro-N-acetylmuramic acid kinase